MVTLVPLPVVDLKGAEIPAVAIHNEIINESNVTILLIIVSKKETVIPFP